MMSSIGILGAALRARPSSLSTSFRTFATEAKKKAVRVAVTGASGQIGYALLFRIANGEMLGKDQPVILHLLELPQAMNSLRGVAMELEDCAFPLLKSIVETDDPNKAFNGADYAMLVGAKPRSKGMERGDLLNQNAAIFSVQGKAINANANRETIRVVVVGNPANTNCLIAARNAPDVDPKRFTAMTRLDHNRGAAQLAMKARVPVDTIDKFAIWGNHSATQFPDITSTTIRGHGVKEMVGDDKWLKEAFIPTVQQRGAAIINVRGLSSAASAANAAVDHIRDWVHGTNGKWTSMAVLSNGEYGADKGLYFSFPVVCSEGNYKIVEGLKFDEAAKEAFNATRQELLTEKKAVEAHLPPPK